MEKTAVLLILDGYGLNNEKKGNAILAAKTPVMDELMNTCPNTRLEASGLAVGLPEGQMGNSEVGHLNMGAGRIIFQELTRITKEIREGDFFKNPALIHGMENAKKNHSGLHLYGLLSDGGVHSHNTHLYALLQMAKEYGLKQVYVHCFLDGRDTQPTSGKGFIEELQEKMKTIGVGEIATVTGRFYAMDRDNRWERIEQAYQALTKGIGETAESAVQAVQDSYEREITDEFMLPTVILKDGKPVATIKDKDSIIFFNFRPDRAREITRTFCMDEFSQFPRGERKKVTYICFTDYDVTIPNKEVAFHKQEIRHTLGEFLAQNKKTQARIAETEKYAHVTFFFNGGVEEANLYEERILVESPKVATYDLQPEMSAEGVCNKLTEAIAGKKYDVIIANFANADMVGHTGVFDAAVKAIETVDTCVGKVIQAVQKADAILLICADHGNAEQLLDPATGEAFTAHTTNKVPLILVNAPKSCKFQGEGCLADIAPTLIELMGMKQPIEMTGHSLLIPTGSMSRETD
ncbi:MAG: 2,3-bisphosphoglycerate-independent phosphoglycerate mutase [Lachnospiraceae bacterium]